MIQRANPALQELDKVLAILAGENKVLARLAVDSDRALQPFAAVRNQVADFIQQSNTVAQASARHRGALARNLQLFPKFLKEFEPAMERLGRFADQTTPVFSDLKVAAPGLDKAFTSLPAFSNSSIKFFKNFGQTAKVSGPALTAIQPLLTRLGTLGKEAKPFAFNASELLTSLRDTGGLERLLDFIFLGTGTSNGYDSLGHFLRSEVVANGCISYVVIASGLCASQKLFNTTGSSGSAETASASAARNRGDRNQGNSVLMARTLAVLNGATPAQALAKFPGATEVAPGAAGTTSGAEATPVAKPVGGASAGTTYYAPSAEGSGADGMLLNYLLGN